MSERFARVVLVLFVVSIPILSWSLEAGVALTLSHLLGMGLVATAGVIWLRERRPVSIDWAWLAVAAFLAVATLSVIRVRLEPDIQMLGESAHAKSVKQLAGLVFGCGVFGALRILMRWYGLAVTALRVHFWVTAVVAVLALGQYAIALVDLQHPLANFRVTNSTFGVTRPLSLMYGFPRVSFTLIEPSMLATYLMTGWSFWLFASDCPPFQSAQWRRLFAGAGVVLGMSIIASGSRMAYMVFATLTVLAIAVRPGRLARIALVSMSVGLGILATGPEHARGLVATLVPRAASAPPGAAGAVSRTRPAGQTHPAPVPSEPARVVGEAATVDGALRRTAESVTLNDVSVQQRVASYLVAAEMVRERPWLGTGIGTSAFYMERHWPATFTALPVDRLASATMMSHYTTILTETGVVGVLCVVLFVGAVVVQLWRGHVPGTPAAGVTAGVGAALMGYAIACAAMALVVYQSLLLWLLLAAALSIPPVAGRRSARPADSVR